MGFSIMAMIVLSSLFSFLLIKNFHNSKVFLQLVILFVSTLFLLIFLFSFYCFKGSAFNHATTNYDAYQPGHYYLYNHSTYTEVTFGIYTMMQILQVGSIGFFVIANLTCFFVFYYMKNELILSKIKRITFLGSLILISIILLYLMIRLTILSSNDVVLATLDKMDLKEDCSYVSYVFQGQPYENVLILSTYDDWEIGKLLYGWVSQHNPSRFIAFLDILILPTIFMVPVIFTFTFATFSR